MDTLTSLSKGDAVWSWRRNEPLVRALLTALLKAAIDGAAPLREPDSTTVTEPAVVTVAEQDRPFAVDA
jgi:hypothetical protein